MICCKGNNINLAFDNEKGILDSLIENGREYIKEKTDIFKLACRDKAGRQKIFLSGEMNPDCSESDEKSFRCS